MHKEPKISAEGMKVWKAVELIVSRCYRPFMKRFYIREISFRENKAYIFARSPYMSYPIKPRLAVPQLDINDFSYSPIISADGSVRIEGGYIHAYSNIDNALQDWDCYSITSRQKEYWHENHKDDDTPKVYVYKSLDDAYAGFSGFLKWVEGRRGLCDNLRYTCVVETIIPKGAEYWEDDSVNEIAARAMIYAE